jgi:hypothetical protein
MLTMGTSLCWFWGAEPQILANSNKREFIERIWGTHRISRSSKTWKRLEPKPPWIGEATCSMVLSVVTDSSAYAPAELQWDC